MSNDVFVNVATVDSLKTAQRTSLAELDALFATLQHRLPRRNFRP